VRAPPFNAQQWGQTRTIPAAAWQPKQLQDVATITTPQRAAEIPPKVRSLVCGLQNNDQTSQNYILRWRVSLGLGGARVDVDFDATRYTRISCPFDECRVSLFADDFNGTGDVPGVDVTAFVFCADGYAEQPAPGPMFSVAFGLVAGQQAVIPLPVGANRFRVVGEEPSGATPFRTTTEYFLRAGVASLRYKIPGVGLVPGVGDLLGMYGRGDFVPIASGVTELVIICNVGVSTGFVQFGLDL